MKIKIHSFIATNFICLGLVFAQLSIAEDFVIGQKNKAFTQKHLTIKKGDTVKFTNEDPFFHNVFSLSDTESFDLGSYPRGQNREVTFDEAGEVEVECAIHPKMHMTITVEE